MFIQFLKMMRAASTVREHPDQQPFTGVSRVFFSSGT